MENSIWVMLHKFPGFRMFGECSLLGCARGGDVGMGMGWETHPGSFLGRWSGVRVRDGKFRLGIRKEFLMGRVERLWKREGSREKEA